MMMSKPHHRSAFQISKDRTSNLNRHSPRSTCIAFGFTSPTNLWTTARPQVEASCAWIDQSKVLNFNGSAYARKRNDCADRPVGRKARWRSASFGSLSFCCFFMYVRDDHGGWSFSGDGSDCAIGAVDWIGALCDVRAEDSFFQSRKAFPECGRNVSNWTGLPT